MISDVVINRKPNVDEVINSTCILFTNFSKKKTKKRKATYTAQGHAVAISNNLALTCFHRDCAIDTIVTLRSTEDGEEMTGKVVFCEFVADAVDIAVIRIDAGFLFTSYVDVSVKPLTLLDEIYIIGLKTVSNDALEKAVFKCEVNSIEKFSPFSSLFQSSYISFDGLSGAGVVTKMENGTCKVVGVHVASHYSTKAVSDDERDKNNETSGSYKSVQKLAPSICSELHGHGSYNLMCEISRVTSLVDFLKAQSDI
jgi:hypothetical protein